MNYNKGSFSIIYLAAILYLIIFAQLMLQHLRNDYERSSAYIKDLQQRQLCRSVLNWLIKNYPNEGELRFNYPISTAKTSFTVEGKHLISDDSMLDYYHCNVYLDHSSHRLRRLGFYPSQELKNYGQSFMFISKYTPTGTNYLTDGSLYTSKGSFNMPTISFLSDKDTIGLNMQTIHENGFSNNFSYLSQATTLTYSSTAKITNGNSFIACTRGLTLQKNFQSTGRLILISNESIILQDNVNLSKALIIAKGNVTIGKNCKITGLVFSSSTIKFQGKGSFTRDTSVVADYVSPISIA